MNIVSRLADLIADKITDIGSHAIMNAVAATPLGAAMEAAGTFSELIEGGSHGVFKELTEKGREQFKEQIREIVKPEGATFKFNYQGQRLIDSLLQAFDKPIGHPKVANWQRFPWAKSREDWLANAWKHDWRSQPRNRIGRWIPGRLPYPVAKAPAIGKGVAKSSRRKRRLNRYKRYGRVAARSYKFGGSS